jgi:phage tail sheath protein FI
MPGQDRRVETEAGDDWKYVRIRRLLIYIERSIDRAIQWAVFEPNGPELWSRVRSDVEQIFTDLWRDGGLRGANPQEAFFVRCDRTTMTQDDLENGRLIVEVGFAAARPAEFVIFRILRRTGDVCA